MADGPLQVPPIPPDPTIVINGVSVVVPQPITKYARFDLMNVLNRVFELLVNVLSAMQYVAAQQANRLNFLTAWQRAYTDELQQIPTFTGVGQNNSANPIGGTETEASNSRQDLNTLNSAFTNNLQGNNSLIQDDAKSMQATVNQSNDAVNQLSDLATSIIQQFNTILGSIFH